MSSPRRPSRELRAGRRAIESLPAVRLLKDLTWFEEPQVWGILCRFTISSADQTLVPTETDWWVTLDERYPHGRVVVRPAAENGLQRTFAHQQYNGMKCPNALWRDGDICVRAPQFTFGKHALDPDPIGCETRLGWYLRRVIAWLDAAAAGRLLAAGDPFELPQFPGGQGLTYIVGHGETTETFAAWAASDKWYGTAELVDVGPRNRRVFAVRRFLGAHGEEVVAYPWGREIVGADRRVNLAVWLRSDNLPVSVPYQAIDRWHDLFAYLDEQGRENLFQRVVDLIRDGDSHVMLLGFPVPLKVGGEACQIHWQPILLPPVSHGNQYQPGFRRNQEGYWMRDRIEVFARGNQPDWHKGENWSSAQATARGRVDDALANRSALVVGVGAVGSLVAEMLVRAGASPTVVCDGDDVENGNLCRHTLRLADLGRNKAEAVAERLNGAHSHADVRFIREAFPPVGSDNMCLANQCDLIIDCTGDDETLDELARHSWETDKLFCSISLSYRAVRAYVFTARGRAFPMAQFQSQFAAWADKDAGEFSEEKLVYAGIGCWHPAFPARVDAVWMMATAAFRRLEEFARATEVAGRLVVFEQVLQGGEFRGIRRA